MKDKKTEAALNKAILLIMTRIQNEFPELSKYIAETPVQFSEEPGIDKKNLVSYYESLCELVAGYEKEHPKSPKNNELK